LVKKNITLFKFSVQENKLPDNSYVILLTTIQITCSHFVHCNVPDINFLLANFLNTHNMQTKQAKTKNRYAKNKLTLFLKNMKTVHSSENTQHIMQENSSSTEP